jgi:hypothetical protein
VINRCRRDTASLERVSVVGPSPYPYASFAALRVVYGEAIFIVCYACHRYALFAWREHAERDSRRTSFSCCVCGGAGTLASEKPLDHIREDTRANPQRHPKATARLTGRPMRPSVAFRLRERPRR